VGLAAELGYAGDFARTDARGADAHGFVRTLLVNPDGLQIREPATTRFIHRVTDIISSHRPLAADIATLSHTNENSTTTQGMLQPRPVQIGYDGRVAAFRRPRLFGEYQ
jgi:hypothetical protein